MLSIILIREFLVGDSAAIVTTTAVGKVASIHQCTASGAPLPTGGALALHQASHGSLGLYLADGLQATIPQQGLARLRGVGDLVAH